MASPYEKLRLGPFDPEAEFVSKNQSIERFQIRKEDLSRYGLILGKLPVLQVYSHIMLSFAMPEGVSQDTIIADPEAAVRQIRSHVPWMAGKVVNVGKGPGNLERYVVAPRPPPDPLIVVRDFARLPS
ncbi:hypothetical protein AtubIFM54640_004979 [Aspergillus tubingensis]|nr:hypothetical protein AtubIFM54640_004979 [Aspergillus tubingensis]